MSYYNKKCKGCGGYLSSDKNSPTYVKGYDEKKEYCYRCFQLNNYGNNVYHVSNQDVTSVLNNMEINDKDTIVVVVDLFDIEGSLVEQFKEKTNVYYVVNKINCLPKKYNRELTFKNIGKIINELGYTNYKNILFYDIREKLGIKNIYNTLFRQTKNCKFYFVGKTNVGKSSLINNLLKIKNKDSKLVTVSSFKNTTLDFNKIKIGMNTIIDTPGFKLDNMIDLMNPNQIKKMYQSKYQIKTIDLKKENSKQAFVIGNCFSLEIEKNHANGSVTFYSYSDIIFHRTKIENVQKILASPLMNPRIETPFNLEIKSHVLDEKMKYTIFVSGLGFIILKGISEINIQSPKEISIFISHNSII